MSSRLSIVMPAYNAENWLQPTIGKLYDGLKVAKFTEFEIIIVNDGSSDNTLAVAQDIAKGHKEVVVLDQDNQGRFITRKRGLMKAKFDRILFIDTRVWIDEQALNFLCSQLRDHPERLVWNGHINVAKKGNIIARFGDALTIIGWRRYFGSPRLTSYGVQDFDHYPKGTGLFTAPRDILVEAVNWFEKNTTDLKNSSDDTLLIRHIAEANRIWLSPDFSATYFARTTLIAFIKHSFYRGQFFVDGFLRKGTRFYVPLILFLFFSPLLFIASVVFPALLIVALGVWILTPLSGYLLGLSARDSFAFFLLAPVFAISYSAGIWRAVIRKAFNGKRTKL